MINFGRISVSIVGGEVNSELAQLVSTLRLEAPESRELALKFSLACAKRVEHLLEDPEVIECLPAHCCRPVISEPKIQI
jgi:hypothetical protein